MNPITLKEFIEHAKKLNHAVKLEGNFDCKVIIEPNAICEWKPTNVLQFDDVLIDVNCVTLAKVVPNLKERNKMFTDTLNNFSDNFKSSNTVGGWSYE